MATVQEIYNEIDRIDNAKSGIAGAIEEKGVEVPAGAKIEEYPGLVRQIQQGDTSDCVKFTPQTLTEEQKAQARENIGAVGGKMGVISQTQTWSGSGSNPRTYVMSNLVTGLIPQANIDLFEAAGATFNATSGYFELNGLTDISYEEMSAIYANTIGLRPIASVRNYGLINIFTRTNIPLISSSSVSVSLTQLAYANTIIEVVAFNGTQMSSASMLNAFASCYRLKSITGIINATSTNIGAVFDNCFSLVDLQMKGIKSSLSFKHSSVLSKDSLLYLINNEASTSAITITLHASVYAKCQSGGEWYSDISTALAAHTNVTLASA